MPDGICGATGLFSDVQSTVSQVGQITGHPGQVEVGQVEMPSLHFFLELKLGGEDGLRLKMLKFLA